MPYDNYWRMMGFDSQEDYETARAKWIADVNSHRPVVIVRRHWWNRVAPTWAAWLIIMAGCSVLVGLLGTLFYVMLRRWM